jgi:hypothetical protein
VASEEAAMKAIIGTVTAVNDRAKTFTVSVETKQRGREISKQFNISSSTRTAFIRKGKRKVRSSLEKMRVGMSVIVGLEDGVALAGPRLPAIEVWHPPIRPSSGTKGIPLTRTECKNLGGKLEKDSSCPSTEPADVLSEWRVRCRTAAGSMCVDEADKKA